MPLDTTTYTETKPDLSKPSLGALAYVLRHGEEWPKPWRWDFRYVTSLECGTAGCALGIGCALWSFPSRTWAPHIAQAMFNITDVKAAINIFAEGSQNKRITAEVVASRIDDYLAGRPIRYLVANDRG